MLRRLHRTHAHLELSPLLALFSGPAPRRQRAAAILGVDDPLVRALERLDVLTAQSWVTALAVVAGAAATAFGVPRAEALLFGAGAVQLGLAVTAAVFVLLRNERARDRIIDGYETLPLSAIERERKRLLSRRRCHCLARSLEELVETAEQWRRRTRPPRSAALRPLFNVRQVGSNASTLRQVAQLLRAEPAAARGVALVERLLTSPGSPLYPSPFEPSSEDGKLDQELRRITDALSTR